MTHSHTHSFIYCSLLLSSTMIVLSRCDRECGPQSQRYLFYHAFWKKLADPLARAEVILKYQKFY